MINFQQADLQRNDHKHEFVLTYTIFVNSA